jgi:hypothetical protein
MMMLMMMMKAMMTTTVMMIIMIGKILKKHTFHSMSDLSDLKMLI